MALAISINSGTFPNFLSIPVKSIIAGIPVECAIEQEHSDRLSVTHHPVESGADITDHSYKEPATVTMRCGWSNASFDALQNIVSGFFSGGSQSASDYVSGIYSQLLALQEFRQKFTVVTLRRTYNNMLLSSLGVTTDKDSAQSLMVEASFEEVIIVSTSTTTLPPMSAQKTPASTAEVVSAGTKSVATGIPSPGGSVPPSKWGSSLISR